VESLALQGDLHAGYEAEAITAFNVINSK
jgi:hypothetical protein